MPATPIPDPILFPFEPDGGQSVVETWNFVTDVLESRNQTEQRRGMRARPSVQLSWLITALDKGESERLFGSIYDNMDNRWYVPMWPYARFINTVIAGVYDVTNQIGTKWDWSGKVAVWSDSGVVDIMNLAAVGLSTITLTGATTFVHGKNHRAVPLAIGSLPQSYQWEKIRHAGRGAVDVEIDTTDVDPIAPLAPTQLYEGKEVLAIHPVNFGGSEKEAWGLAGRRIGTGLGPFVFRPSAPTPTITRQMTWILDGHSAVMSFKQWLMTRMGRRNAFWIPSYSDDLTLAAAPVSGNAYIDIVACDFLNKFYPYTSRRRVALLSHPSTVAPLTVTGVTSPGAGVERLALSGVVPQNFAINTRLSFLTLSRLDSDSISMTYESFDTISVALPIKEVPREV